MFKWWSPTARAARQVANLPRFSLHGKGSERTRYRIAKLIMAIKARRADVG
jgi:hypothetical protein